jgi:hypothetical protein
VEAQVNFYLQSFLRGSVSDAISQDAPSDHLTPSADGASCSRSPVSSSAGTGSSARSSNLPCSPGSYLPCFVVVQIRVWRLPFRLRFILAPGRIQLHQVPDKRWQACPHLQPHRLQFSGAHALHPLWPRLSFRVRGDQHVSDAALPPLFRLCGPGYASAGRRAEPGAAAAFPTQRSGG